MKKSWSIGQKLTSSIMLLINSIFIILLSLIIISNAISVNKNRENSKSVLKNAIMENEKTTATSNSKVMSDPVKDKTVTVALNEQIYSTIVDTARANPNQIIIGILILWMVSLYIGYLVTKRIVNHITRPIVLLVKSSKLIAQGNYSVPIKLECYDEICDLATNLESMRETTNKYTNCLQDIVDEKILQLNDILNNIDQGLFTINLDGSVNQEYSVRANQILKVSDIASSNIQSILRMDEQQLSKFHIWLELIQKNHQQSDWLNLTRLAPVQELELLKDPDRQEISYVSISYKCIYDTENNLSKIMILATDISDKHRCNSSE